MESLNKYFIGILLMASIILAMLACDKEDDQPRLDPTLLYGKQWQLIQILVNEKGQEFEDPVETCKQDDTVEFKSDKIFTRKNGESKCSQEADSEVSQWSIFYEPKAIIFEGIEYEIVELTSTNLSLQRKLQGIDGAVMVRYNYTSN